MAKYAKFDDVTLPIFDGEGYSNWKFRLMQTLEYKECLVPATRERGSADDEAVFSRKDLKARTILINALSDRQLEYVRKKSTVLEMLNTLDEIYSTKSTPMQILCRSKIEDIRMKNYSTLEDFFSDYEKACNDYAQAGGALDEQEKMRYLIRALPPSYAQVGEYLDVLPTEKQTVDYIKAKIREKNLIKSEFEKPKSASAFNAKTKGLCYTCGRAGHKQAECWHNSNQNQNTSQRGGHRGRGHFSGFQRGTYRGNSRGRSNNNNKRQQQQETAEQGTSSGKVLWAVQVNHQKLKNKNSKKLGKNELVWLLDSGCTDHIIESDKYFYECIELKKHVEVKLPDEKVFKAKKMGNVKLIFKNSYNTVEVELKNVFFIEGIKKNLLSLSKISKTCTVVARGDDAKIYNTKTRELVTVAEKKNDLYLIRSCVDMNDEYMYANNLTLKEKWHRSLGHVNFDYLEKIVKNKLLDGLPEKIENVNFKCENCIKSKMSNLPFENDRSKATEILEIIHTDLNGPHPTTGYCGEKYFLTFIDDYSKCTQTYCIKTKDQTASCFIEYINLVENLFNKRVKKLQCDNGREYLNKDIYNFARFKGIEILPCPPHVHELNGVAERYNRSAMDIGRCLMREARINLIYWPEVMKTVSYLKNRTIANTDNNKTPFEILFGVKPNVKHLKIYGSKVYVRKPESKRKNKWDDKAEVGILVGYAKYGYRVLVKNKVFVARHVRVIEDETELICKEGNVNENHQNKSNDSESEEIEVNLKNDDYDDESVDVNDTDERIDRNIEKVESSDDENGNLNLPVRRKSVRTKSPIQRYGNPVAHLIYVNFINANVPNTYNEAINSSESDEWIKAMNSEIKSLEKNKTWSIVDKPADVKIIDVKWVYTRKKDDSYKARLVARGYQQIEQIENLYSPVGKMQTLKILLSFCCTNGLCIEQMDVETAFLNGKLKSEIYVKEPIGYETGKDKVCKLKKALYGLRESPRVWYETFDCCVNKLGFVKSKYDNCLYVKRSEKDTIYLLVFVDDLLICAKARREITKIKIELMKNFVMKDMGKVERYIGIDIDYNENLGIMKLSQKNYIESLSEKYNLEDEKFYDTPMEPRLKLEQAKNVDERIKYRNLIGELLYICSGTRPDVAYCVNYLSRFQNCYDRTHFKHALRVLKYLIKTKDIKLIYERNVKNENLDCMVDSDYAGDTVDRKSTSGYIIRMNGNLIYWKSRKQKAVTKNSTFAEYTALSDAVTELLFIRKLLNESFYLEIKNPIKIYEDNIGALLIAKYGNMTKNSKYIEVQYHYVNENCENGKIEILKIKSEENLADILTKSLDKGQFEILREKLKLLVD